MKKIKSIKYIKIMLFYTVIIFLVGAILKYYNLYDNFLNYINFNTKDLKFQDLLSILLTILSIFLGAIITVSTVLISMCDRRIMKLINEYKHNKNVISNIKISILSGIITVVLLAIIYSNLVFNIKALRYIILYISGLTLISFINNSRILIIIVLNILDNSFEDGNSIKEQGQFHNPEN